MPPRAIYEHSGPAELVLEGENLTPDTLKLYHNGVLYTPLESSDTYAYYLLGDNGTNKVMLNGKNFNTIIVKDVVVPAALPTLFVATQRDNNLLNGINRLSVQGVCINYPYMSVDDHPIFAFEIGSNAYPFTDAESENYGLANCTGSVTSREGVNGIYIFCRATDPTKPAYITYKGFIVAVFNYSA